jgi:hypothetical protein
MSRALRPPPGQDVNCQRSDRQPQQGEDHGNPRVHPAKIRMGSGAGHLRDVPEEPAGCPGSPLRIWAHGLLGEQPVQLRPSCHLSSGQGSRWRGWIGCWRSSRAYLRGGWLPNGTGSRYRRGSVRVGVHQPLASSCPGAVPGVRAQRTPPHSDRRRQSDGGLSGLPAPLGSVQRARPSEFCRSFSGHERANYGREAGTDARKAAVSQQVIRNVCLGERTLDQESPGSSPGGAMKPGNDLSVAGLFLSARGTVVG